MKLQRILGALALLGASTFISTITATMADAHEYYVPGMTVVHPWGEATAPGATSAPIYFTVDNVTKADRIVKVVTPLAETVEFRDAGSDSKPPLKSLNIKPGDTEFTAGKRHLLLKGLKMPLQWGRSYEMLLMFEKGGPLQVQVSIGAH